MPKDPRWNGHVRLGLGWAMYMGPLFDTPIHTHHSIQCYVCRDATFELSQDPSLGWCEYEAVIIRSGEPHSLRARGIFAIMLLLEPESANGRKILTKHRDAALWTIPAAKTRLIQDALVEATSETLTESGLQRLQQLLFSTLELDKGWSQRVDSRIARAVANLQRNPAHPWKVTEMATASQLSTRHFRDLFTTQIGISPRRYIQWLRVRTAAFELTKHASISRAAVNAGFADAAHLTRCFRRMTGISPSGISQTLNRTSFGNMKIPLT